MALSVVQALAIPDALSGSFTTPTTAGNTVVVVVMCGVGADTAMSVTGVTLGGSAGNFAQAESVNSGYADAAIQFAGIWVDPDCAGGQTAVVVSGTNLGDISDDNGIVIMEVAGLVSSASLASVLDKSTSDSGTTGTALSTGTTATTTQASEIFIAGMSGYNAVSAFTSGWTVVAVNDGTGEYNAAAYKIVSATGTAVLGCTQAGSAPWAAAVITLKAASSSGVTSTGAVSLATMAAAGTGAESGVVTSTGAASLATMAAAGSGSVANPTTYSIWGQATETWSTTGVNPGSIGMEFTVSEAGKLNGVWLYSPAGQGLTGLPTTIGLYTVSGTTLVTSQTPSWSGAAGSGWVYGAFLSPPNLAASTDYMLAAYGAAGSFGYDSAFTWPVTSGPITGVNGGYYATAGSLAYPSSQQAGWNWWLDLSFTPTATSVTSTGAASLASMAAAGTGSAPVIASGGASLAPMAAAGSGAETIPSSGAASLATMAAAGTGASFYGVNGTGAAFLATMAAAGTGATPVVATGGAALSSMAAAGTGAETIGSTGAAALATMAAHGAGGSLVTSTGAASLTSMSAAGTGAETVTASGSPSLAAMAAHGTGTVGAVVTATGEASLAAMHAAGTGKEAITATGAASLATMAAAGTGGQGSGQLTISIASAAGTDQFGNAYQQGVWVYGGGAAVGLTSGGDFEQAELILSPGGATQSTTPPNVFSNTFDPGETSEYQQATFNSGQTGTGDIVQMVVETESPDASNPATWFLYIGSTDYVDGSNPLIATKDAITVGVPLSSSSTIGASNFSGSYAGGQAAVSTVSAASTSTGWTTAEATFLTTYASAINGIIARLISAGLIV